MYVYKIAISKFRCFKHAELILNHPQEASEARLPNVNLLLGMNGTGKTTVLKALALGILSPIIQNSGYVPYYLVRRTKARHGKPEPRALLETEVILNAQDFEGEIPVEAAKISTEIVSHGNLETISNKLEGPYFSRIYDETSPAFFVVGYGATRRVEDADNVEVASRKRRILRYQRVAGLFEEYIGLTPLGAWLQAGNAPARAEEVVALINSLLPVGTRFTGILDRDREPLFTHRGIDLPLGALSDGYRAYIGLIGDLLYHLQLSCPPSKKVKLTDLPGMVLVDDIDLQLHPSWQRQVVPQLARAFPRLQFVLTTHSPLVAGTLHPTNIFLMEDSDGSARVRQISEPIHGLSADEVLTSSYFDLDTTRAPDAEQKLARLARQAENGDPEEAVKFLRELSGKQPAE